MLLPRKHSALHYLQWCKHECKQVNTGSPASRRKRKALMLFAIWGGLYFEFQHMVLAVVKHSWIFGVPCFSVNRVLPVAVVQQPKLAWVLWSALSSIFAQFPLAKSHQTIPYTSSAGDLAYRGKKAVLHWVSELSWLWKHFLREREKTFFSAVGLRFWSCLNFE